MNPSDLPPDTNPAFLADLAEFMALPAPEAFKELTDEEQLACFRRRVDILRRWPDEFRALDWDYAAMLAQVEDALRELTDSYAHLEKTTEAYLQSTADLADAEFGLFKQWKAIAERLYEEKPFDPEVQRLKEELDELSQQFPKE